MSFFPERKKDAGVPSHHTEAAPSAARRGDAAEAAPGASSRVRIFPRVPTHAVAMPNERRYHPRAYLKLPMRLVRVANRAEPVPVTLLTQNISSSGAYFLAPRDLAPGTPLELEVGLVERPLGMGSVRMSTAARVVRSQPSATPGWHGVAVQFDDIDFHRDEDVPSRFYLP